MESFEWTFVGTSRDDGATTIRVVAKEYKTALIAAAAEAAGFSTRLISLEFVRERPVVVSAMNEAGR